MVDVRQEVRLFLAGAEVGFCRLGLRCKLLYVVATLEKHPGTHQLRD